MRRGSCRPANSLPVGPGGWKIRPHSSGRHCARSRQRMFCRRCIRTNRSLRRAIPGRAAPHNSHRSVGSLTSRPFGLWRRVRSEDRRRFLTALRELSLIATGFRTSAPVRSPSHHRSRMCWVKYRTRAERMRRVQSRIRPTFESPLVRLNVHARKAGAFRYGGRLGRG